MASNTEIPSGYNYEFLQVVPDDYTCVICHLVMRNPVQTKCGHRFCRDCLEVTIKRNPQCPVDRKTLTTQDFSKIFDDVATEREILSLKIRCPEEDCYQQVELRDIENHEKQCQYKTVPCSYQNIGCGLKVPRKDLNKHNENYVNQHLQIAVEKILSMEQDFYCKMDDINRMHIQQQMDEMKKQMDEMKKQMDEIIITITNRIDRIDNKIEEMEEQIPPVKLIGSTQKQIDSMEKRYFLTIFIGSIFILIIFSLLIANVKNKQLTMTKDDDMHYSYVWKVMDFSQQLETAKQSGRDIELYSEPFYTHKYGYKLKLRLDPNGHGVGKGTHVSVFLVVMRGDYDAMLTWPFDWKFKFILMDQKPNPLQRKNIETTITPESHKSFQKPTTDEDLGYGYAQYVSHETLATEKYVVDNTLFLKLELEKP